MSRDEPKLSQGFFDRKKKNARESEEVCGWPDRIECRPQTNVWILIVCRLSLCCCLSSTSTSCADTSPLQPGRCFIGHLRYGNCSFRNSFVVEFFREEFFCAHTKNSPLAHRRTQAGSKRGVVGQLALKTLIMVSAVV